jgi:hypothetical protein
MGYCCAKWIIPTQENSFSEHDNKSLGFLKVRNSLIA